MPKKLTVTFRVPSKQIKNSNAAMGHIISAQRSAWIRNYAEAVWAQAIKEQYGVTAVEPQDDDLPAFELSDEAKAVYAHLEGLEQELKALELEEAALASLAEAHRADKALLRKLKREKATPEEVNLVEEKIYLHEQTVAANKAGKKRVKATISSSKKLQLPAVGKELRRIEGQKRKAYIKKKLELNEHQQLFKTCAVIVRVHNITKHAFDAPNFYPTVKPILDAATDTGVLWPDDNNSVIQGGTLFLFGENLEKDHYIFEIEVTDEWPWEA